MNFFFTNIKVVFLGLIYESKTLFPNYSLQNKVGVPQLFQGGVDTQRVVLDRPEDGGSFTIWMSEISGTGIPIMFDSSVVFRPGGVSLLYWMVGHPSPRKGHKGLV